MLIVLTAKPNKTYFGQKNIKSLKIAEYPLHQLIRLSRLEIHVALLKSQPVDFRILFQGYCVPSLIY